MAEPSSPAPPDDDGRLLCTRAVTGPDRPAHQPIFVCDTCRPVDDGDGDGEGREPLPSCVCQSCAEVCHAGHDVYYVGSGPCTCDCPSLIIKDAGREEAEEVGYGEHKCHLEERSAREATRLGFGLARVLNDPLPLRVPPPMVLETASQDGSENSDDDGQGDEKANEKEESDPGGIAERMSDLCIECDATLGGYAYASFALPGLADNGGGPCQDLIRQAEALTECSHDTFWVPDERCAAEKADEGLCDLEVLAGQIYRQHVRSHSLQPSEKGDSDLPASSEGGGAEWWVQVKPAGQSRAPVDLHYDKDEALAESFGLGSFPTLSTVTYLTGEDDNAPTVVFPHTYHDEEDRRMESMLLSRPALAKHLVFDGRLLHGAPAHPALRRSAISNNESNVDGIEGGGDEDGGSSLRVTFLVNVWTSGRPAGVDVLPESIRAKVRAAASGKKSFQSVMESLEFEERRVSKITVPAKPVGEDDAARLSEGEKIVLPFVSHGATWIDDDEEAECDTEENAEAGSAEEENVEGGESRNSQDSDEEEEEEYDDELVLVLSPFATQDYAEDEADTAVLSFEKANAARLVRGVMSDEKDIQGCLWKKLADESKSNKAGDFLSDLHQFVPPFVTTVTSELKSRFGMDVTDLEADHVCYRTDSIEQYTSLVEALQFSDDFALLVESEIGGRPISTFKLAVPIEFKSEDSTRSIDVIEIPSPKEGSPYEAGLEHVEFVVGDGSFASPINDESHRAALEDWMARFPSVPWNVKALGKRCNPDVSTRLELGDFGNTSVKFHLMPLEDVIKFEGR